jgi:nicotinamidase-related amidase
MHSFFTVEGSAVAASPRLRTLEGLGDTPSALGRAALVLIDCQNTYREGVMELVGVEPALKEAAELLRRARDAGRPVIHVQQIGEPGGPYDIAAPIGQLADVVAPRDGEPVVTKEYPNSFVETDLDARLKDLGVTDLVLVGFMTHMCVNSTARGAYNLGYAVTVVDRATATRSLQGPDGSVVPAEVLHRASLTALSDLFAAVVPGAADIPD